MTRNKHSEPGTPAPQGADPGDPSNPASNPSGEGTGVSDTSPHDDKPNEGIRTGQNVTPQFSLDKGADMSGDNPSTRKVEPQTDLNSPKEANVTPTVPSAVDPSVQQEEANKGDTTETRLASLEQQVKTLQESNQRTGSFVTQEQLQKAVNDAVTRAKRDIGLIKADEYQNAKTFPEPGSKMFTPSAP